MRIDHAKLIQQHQMKTKDLAELEKSRDELVERIGCVVTHWGVSRTAASRRSRRAGGGAERV